MTGFLASIIEHKRSEVAALRRSGLDARMRQSKRRPFAAALDRRPRMAVIAEVKKASPSKGLICAEFDPEAIAGRYEKGGAAAISVLTEQRFFQGSLDHLRAVRACVGLPVLRKDFIIDPLQVEEAAGADADAILLIAAALDDAQLTDLHQAAAALEMDALVEIHNAAELDRVMKLETPVIGINNRDLQTFHVDLKVTFDLIGIIPASVTVVSESGIAGAADSRRLLNAGARAVLVGESLMRSADPSGLIKELTLAGEN
jgi:indole-3-glycerol phosphate synthase